MHNAPNIALVGVAIVTLLGGCALIPGASGQRSYSSVTALKDAYLDAGGVCEGGFSQDNKVKAARQSGVCGEDVVLSVYKTKADLDGVVSTMRAFEQGFENPDKILVGPNWIVNSPDIKKVQETIGGKIVDLGD